MALACNIDQRGRLLRIGLGFGLVVAAVAASAQGGLWNAAGLLALGGFTLFEGVKGWCAVVALLSRATRGTAR